MEIIANYDWIIQGRLQTLEVEVNEHTFTIISIYDPNTNDISLFNKLDEYLGWNDENTFIIGGDFNTILKVELDEKYEIKYTHPRKNTFNYQWNFFEGHLAYSTSKEKVHMESLHITRYIL